MEWNKELTKREMLLWVLPIVLVLASALLYIFGTRPIRSRMEKTKESIASSEDKISRLVNIVHPESSVQYDLPESYDALQKSIRTTIMDPKTAYGEIRHRYGQGTDESVVPVEISVSIELPAAQELPWKTWLKDAHVLSVQERKAGKMHHLSFQCVYFFDRIYGMRDVYIDNRQQEEGTATEGEGAGEDDVKAGMSAEKRSTTHQSVAESTKEQITFKDPKETYAGDVFCDTSDLHWHSAPDAPGIYAAIKKQTIPGTKEQGIVVLLENRSEKAGKVLLEPDKRALRIWHAETEIVLSYKHYDTIGEMPECSFCDAKGERISANCREEHGELICSLDKSWSYPIILEGIAYPVPARQSYSTSLSRISLRLPISTLQKIQQGELFVTLHKGMCTTVAELLRSLGRSEDKGQFMEDNSLTAEDEILREPLYLLRLDTPYEILEYQ